MTTLNLTELFGQNVDQLKETQEQIKRKAYSEVATRIDQIQELLDEIKQIKNSADIEVDLYSLGSTMSDIDDDEFASKWYSSSC